MFFFSFFSCVKFYDPDKSRRKKNKEIKYTIVWKVTLSLNVEPVSVPFCPSLLYTQKQEALFIHRLTFKIKRKRQKKRKEEINHLIVWKSEFSLNVGTASLPCCSSLLYTPTGNASFLLFFFFIHRLIFTIKIKYTRKIKKRRNKIHNSLKNWVKFKCRRLFSSLMLFTPLLTNRKRFKHYSFNLHDQNKKVEEKQGGNKSHNSFKNWV